MYVANPLLWGWLQLLHSALVLSRNPRRWIASVPRRQSQKSPRDVNIAWDQLEHATKDPEGCGDVLFTNDTLCYFGIPSILCILIVSLNTDSHTYGEMLSIGTTCNTLTSHSVIIREVRKSYHSSPYHLLGKATTSLRKRDEWKKLWHRQHSHPVSRSLASPATSLVLRPRHAFARPLLFTYSERRRARTFLTTVSHTLVT
jgi:hypothetical protein